MGRSLFLLGKRYREKLLRGGIAKESTLHDIEISITRRMTEICKLAADAEASPVLTHEEVEKLMFAESDTNAVKPALYPEMDCCLHLLQV